MDICFKPWVIIQYSLFCCSNVSSLGHWELLIFSCVLLTYYHHYVCLCVCIKFEYKVLNFKLLKIKFENLLPLTPFPSFKCLTATLSVNKIPCWTIDSRVKLPRLSSLIFRLLAN